jgi:hypothetical protein
LAAKGTAESLFGALFYEAFGDSLACGLCTQIPTGVPEELVGCGGLTRSRRPHHARLGNTFTNLSDSLTGLTCGLPRLLYSSLTGGLPRGLGRAARCTRSSAGRGRPTTRGTKTRRRNRYDGGRRAGLPRLHGAPNL